MTIKNNGVYYTPKALAEFMVKHAFSSVTKGKELSILEPSCGDGVFIEAINEFLKGARRNKHSIECVEIDHDAISKTKSRPTKNIKKIRHFDQDYLDFLKDKRKRYDLVIGNPPYVVRKRLAESTIEKCKAIYQSTGLNNKYFRNLWAAFVVGSINLLSDRGVLAFVIPAEFLQVKFTEELRKKVLSDFERIEVVSFQSIIFEDIEQDTIILFCYKHHPSKGLYFCEKRDVADLLENTTTFKSKSHTAIQSVKWTGHILTKEELALLSKLKKKFSPISDYCSAVAGIVTAANNYFIVDDRTVKEYGLKNFVLPIIQRGLYVNGSAVFTKADMDFLRESGKSCNLLNFSGRAPESFSNKVVRYLELGEEQEIDLRHKCRKRFPWYAVPGVWNSEGFFFKRSHLYPKMLANLAGAMVTDSAYRIKMFDGYDIQSLVYSFYNSLSLSLAELEGRYYGGGVLELTPNEFKSIVIPYTPIVENDFSSFVEKFESKKSIDEVCTVIDQKILVDHYGLAQNQVDLLQSIKKKLTNRRLGKLKQSQNTN